MTLSKSQSGSGHRQKGFSLVELMVVVAIVLVVAVVSVPQVLNGMRFLRLRSNATNIATLLQQARMRSVRDNRSYQLLSGTPASMGNQPVLFIDTNFDGAYSAGEPVTQMAADVNIIGGPPGTTTNAALQALMAPPTGGGPAPPMNLTVFSPVPLPGAATAPAFNQRGVPCQAGGPGGLSGVNTFCNTAPGAAGAPPLGFAIYLQSNTVPVDGWSVVTVSPGGRIRTWSYSQNGVPWR